jgi:tetratricopeptide (TPR) repeat protein
LKAGKSRKHELEDSLRASLYNGRGEAFYALGKYDIARDNFDKALDIRKNVPDVYYNRGMARLQLNKTEDAEEDLLKSLKLRPGNVRYEARLAEVYFHQKKFDPALNLLNKAIPKKNADSSWMQPLYLRAKCLVQVKNYADAFRDFNTVAKSGLNENFPSLNTDLGFVYLAFNQPDSALVYFSKDNRNSSDAMSMYGTALVYSQKIKWDQAFSYLEKALATKKIPRSMLSDDDRVKALKADKRYKKLIKKYF